MGGYTFFYIDAQVALSIQVACYTLTFWLRIVFLEKNLPKMNEAKPLQLQAAMQQRLTTYSIPNGIWGLFYWLQMGGERWMIEYFLTTSDVGIYSLMVNIGNVGVITTYMLVTQFIQPMVFEKFSDMTDAAKFQQGFKFIWAYTLVMIIIVITFVAITALFSTQMLLALSRPDFVAAAHLLPIICGGLGCFAISQTLTMTGQALGQPQAYLKTRLSISVLGIVLNFFGCKYFGLLGIGLSSIVSNLIGVCLILLINRQLLKKQIQLNSVLM
jgi:O-antigen/teichoic acid export membrane protein